MTTVALQSAYARMHQSKSRALDGGTNQNPRRTATGETEWHGHAGTGHWKQINRVEPPDAEVAATGRRGHSRDRGQARKTERAMGPGAENNDRNDGSEANHSAHWTNKHRGTYILRRSGVRYVLCWLSWRRGENSWLGDAERIRIPGWPCHSLVFRVMSRRVFSPDTNEFWFMEDGRLVAWLVRTCTVMDLFWNSAHCSKQGHKFRLDKYQTDAL